MSRLPPQAIHNLPALFEHRCRQQPDELAYALIRDNLEIESHLTYAQLEGTVRSLPAISHRFPREPEPFCSTLRDSMPHAPFGHVSVPGLYQFLLRLPTPSGGNMLCPDCVALSRMPRYRWSSRLQVSRLCLRNLRSPKRPVRLRGWRQINPTLQSIWLSCHGLTGTPLPTCNIRQDRRPRLAVS